jgi:hypothetical protein
VCQTFLKEITYDAFLRENYKGKIKSRMREKRKNVKEREMEDLNLDGKLIAKAGKIKVKSAHNANITIKR